MPDFFLALGICRKARFRPSMILMPVIAIQSSITREANPPQFYLFEESDLHRRNTEVPAIGADHHLFGNASLAADLPGVLIEYHAFKSIPRFLADGMKHLKHLPLFRIPAGHGYVPSLIAVDNAHCAQYKTLAECHAGKAKYTLSLHGRDSHICDHHVVFGLLSRLLAIATHDASVLSRLTRRCSRPFLRNLSDTRSSPRP